MALIATFEAKRVATFALDIAYARVLVLNAVVTSLVRTPPHILIVISVGFAEPFLVSLEIVPNQEFHELRVRNDNIA